MLKHRCEFTEILHGEPTVSVLLAAVKMRIRRAFEFPGLLGFQFPWIFSIGRKEKIYSI